MSKATLHTIHAEPAVSLDVFDRLTEVCEAAKAQKISAVGIAIVYRDGSTGTAYSTTPSVSLLIAAAVRLQHRLLKIGDE